MSTDRGRINYGADHKLSKALRDTSSRALFDISAQCPRGSFGAVPPCLAEKSDVLGQLACHDEGNASEDGKLPAVAPAELLHQWICCSSRIQAGEIDCESTATLAGFLNVADYFADHESMEQLSSLLGMRLRRASAGLQEADRCTYIQTLPDCYRVLSGLPAHILAPVLLYAPITVDDHIGNLSPENRAQVIDVYFPELTKHGRLRLDCSQHSTSTCIELLHHFARTKASGRKSLTLENFSLGHREELFDSRSQEALLRAWYAAVGYDPHENVKSPRPPFAIFNKDGFNPFLICIDGLHTCGSLYQPILSALPHCSSLRSLELRNLEQMNYNPGMITQVSMQTVISVLSTLTMLESLKLERVWKAGFPEERRVVSQIMQSIECLTKLTALHVDIQYKNYIGSAGMGLMQVLQSLTQLHSLYTSCMDRAWTPEVCQYLTDSLICLPELTSLQLCEHGNFQGAMPLSPDDFETWPNVFTGLVALTGLKKLGIESKCTMVASPQRLCNALGSMTLLEDFDLEFTQWSAESVLGILEMVRKNQKCTRLVFKGLCATYATHQGAIGLETAIAQALLMPTLHHLDVDLHRDRTQHMGVGIDIPAWDHHIEAVQGRPSKGIYAQVANQQYPHLTHLKFRSASGLARTVVFSAMHGMHALKLLDIRVDAMGYQMFSTMLYEAMSAMRVELALVAQRCPLKTLHIDVDVKTPYQKILMQAICAFTTLTELSLTTAHLDRPDDVFDRQSTTTHRGAGQFGIFENLLSASQLTQLTIKGHVLGRHKMPKSIAKVLESATSLKELSITSDGHHVPCITLTRAMSNLTQLEKLTYGLVMREVVVPDEPENILEVFVDTLGKLVHLREVTISRFRGVTSDAMARILRSMTNLRALRKIDVQNCEPFQRRDHEALWCLLDGNSAVQNVLRNRRGDDLRSYHTYQCNLRAQPALTPEAAWKLARRVLQSIEPTVEPLRCPQIAFDARGTLANIAKTDTPNSFWLLGLSSTPAPPERLKPTFSMLMDQWHMRFQQQISAKEGKGKKLMRKVLACDKKLPELSDADDQHKKLLCQYIKLRTVVDVERLMHECHAWRKGWHNELMHSPALYTIIVSDGEKHKMLPEIKEVSSRRVRSQSSSNPPLGLRQGSTLQQKARGGT